MRPFSAASFCRLVLSGTHSATRTVCRPRVLPRNFCPSEHGPKEAQPRDISADNYELQKSSPATGGDRGEFICRKRISGHAGLQVRTTSSCWDIGWGSLKQSNGCQTLGHPIWAHFTRAHEMKSFDYWLVFVSLGKTVNGVTTSRKLASTLVCDRVMS